MHQVGLIDTVNKTQDGARATHTQKRPCRGTLLIRKRLSLGPYSRPMPRALWWSWGGGEPSQSWASLGGNVKRFQGGLVLKAHRLVYHSTLGLRVMKKKKKLSRRDLDAEKHGRIRMSV